MAKHPVPKKKVSQSRTAKRYASFAFKKHRKLRNFVNVIKCSSCGGPRLNQQACPSCGSYRGRSVVSLERAAAKVTKVKA